MDTRTPATTDTSHDPATLSDPDLIKRWAKLRFDLLRTAQDTPEWGRLKADYDTVAAEYRRRIDGQAS